MSLKITHLDENNVTGLLDESLPFSVTRSASSISARIADWQKRQPCQGPATSGSMRSAAYEMLARYREGQRPAKT